MMFKTFKNKTSSKMTQIYSKQQLSLRFEKQILFQHSSYKSMF